MANNITLTVYLGSNEDGQALLESIQAQAKAQSKGISPFIKQCIIKEIKALESKI